MSSTGSAAGSSPSFPTSATFVAVRRILALAGILIVLILGIWGALRSRGEGIPSWQLFLVPPAVLLATMGPFIFYLTDLRSLAMSVGVGLVMIAVTFWMLFVAFTSDSTSALFLVVLAPVLDLVLVGLALLIDFLRFGPAFEKKSALPLDDSRYEMEGTPRI